MDMRIHHGLYMALATAFGLASVAAQAAPATIRGPAPQGRLDVTGPPLVRGPAGTRTAHVFNVRMCTQTPCANPVAGAERRMQLRVRLQWVDGPDWSTWQGNARHDGHVPIAVDPGRITHAWSAEVGTADLSMQQAVTTGGAAILCVGDTLLALDLRDGSQRWRLDLPAGHGPRAPGAANGRGHLSTRSCPTSC